MAPAAAASEPDSSSGAVQLLLRNLESRTTVIRAQREDTLDSVVDRLVRKEEGAARRCDLRILYAGRALPCYAAIGELGLPRDAILHVSSRLRSTAHARAWSVASKIASVAMARSAIPAPVTAASGPSSADAASSLESLVGKFLDLAHAFLEMESTPASLAVIVANHLDIFLQSGASVVLVQQYLSGQDPCRAEAERAIRCFLSPDRIVNGCTAPVLLEMCRSIFATGEPKDDGGGGQRLYTDLRGVLATVLSDPVWAPAWWLDVSRRQWVAELVSRFAGETAKAVMDEIAVGTAATTTTNLAEFKVFWSVLQKLVLELDADTKHLQWRTDLSETLVYLLRSVDECMARFEASLPRSPWGEHAVLSSAPPPAWTASMHSVWAVLDELDAWSLKEAWWVLRRALRATLAEHPTAATALVMSSGRELRMNGSWIARHRDILPFEARRHLALAMVPEPVTGVDAQPLYEMFIDRSRLLPDSFGYIANATTQELGAALSMAFKHEQAAGPGVLRVWFCLVCQALFSRDLVLFSACPHDRRKFFINPSSVVDPLNLQYFEFTGRMIALSLMHKIHVGVFFDRTLFLHLAGRPITLDDIADADPSLHTGCKKILEMDPNLVDSNILGLTFVREIEVLGSRTDAELIPGGKDIVVTSQNRCNYIDLLIQDRFVNSTRCQLDHFATGFSSLFDKGKLWRKFFESLDATDFDLMLGGSSKDNIDVKEWRAYTDYRGYKGKDRQIKWFWEAVENMSVEQ